MAVAPHLQKLDNELHDKFGPYYAHAWLSLLVALTGRTESPVSARMVVSSIDVQDTIANFIIDMMGKHQAAYFTGTTESGLLALAGFQSKGLKCLIHDGIPDDSKARDVLYRLIQHRPVRMLDGSPTGNPRDRQITQFPACLLVHGDACNDAGVQSHLITIRFDPSKSAVGHLARRSLVRWQSGGHDANLTERDALNILGRADWQGLVQIPVSIHDVFDNIRDTADLSRITSVLSLASIWRRLRDRSSDGSNAMVLESGDVDFVLRLLQAVKAPVDRTQLSRPATDCLRILQKNRRMMLGVKGGEENKRGYKHQHIGKKNCEWAGPFTYYGAQELTELRGISIDAIRSWFGRLENTGLLCQQGKHGRKVAFDLTEFGINWKPGLLADYLRVLMKPLFAGTNSDSQSNGLHSPTVGDSTAENTNSDAFSAPPKQGDNYGDDRSKGSLAEQRRLSDVVDS